MSDTAASIETQPVPQAALDLARAAVREYFTSCFWFWNPNAAITSDDDVRQVIELLRGYGDKRAWRAAQDIQRCL